MQYPTRNTILKKPVVWKDLFFYRKSDTLYQLTVVFCSRFLPAHGDRTVDQMVQAARSGKQNIVEGSEDGKTSSEMEIKLINVARSSLLELREDYLDYLKRNNLPLWDSEHPRYETMRRFCSKHNDYRDYKSFAEQLNDEELANMALTLCHQTDKLMTSYLEKLKKRFVIEGGIKERMHAARTGYRENADQRLKELEAENQRLKEENQHLRQLLGMPRNA